MIEDWREHTVQEEPLDWMETESALEPITRPGFDWPALTMGAVAGLMTLWMTVVIYSFMTQPPQGIELDTLLPRVSIACVPLALGALIMLLIRHSDAAARQRLGRGEGLVLDTVQRLDDACSHFASSLVQNRQAGDEQAARWHELADGLVDRTTILSRQLSEDLLALDGCLERVDSAAAGARSDLTAVLTGLPKVDRQTRDLVGSLREAGLTAHEGAGALDAQLGLLRHRAGEADAVASAATTRLAAQLERMESIGHATADQLTSAAKDAARAHDLLMERADHAFARSATALTDRTGEMTGAIESAERRIGEVAERSGAQMAARLDLLDERGRGSTTVIATARAELSMVLAQLDERLCQASERLEVIAEQGAAGIQTLDDGFQRLNAEAETMTGRIGTGEEAMTFALGRAESLLTALDAAARELDETLPASFGRFERSAGEGFQRLSDAMPALERYHALTNEATGHLASADERLSELNTTLVRQVSDTDEAVSSLTARVERIDSSLASAGEDRLPHLLARLQAAHDIAANLGLLAAQTIDEALPPARQRLIEAVSQPLSEAIDERARNAVERAAAMTVEAVRAVDDATERLHEVLARVESTGRALAERSDSVLALASDQNEASFSRRVALLIEALNSTAVDVSKVLSNEVPDTAWAAYLKGDRGVFTRRAVRLLDTGEAREILRAYEEDGEFRAQVGRYIHDFEALLRTVLADANGSVMAVTLLSSDTGKLYVALAQSIERLRG